MNGFVLVVDDDESIRESLCEILNDEGYPAVGAANGQEALDLLRGNGRPRLILLDLMMPVMDGATFREEQLGDADLSGIPVAVITAAGARLAPAIAAEAWLAKPLRVESLLTVVEKFFQD